MGQKEFKKIISFLKEKKAIFELVEHEPVFTSKQAAKIRGCEPKEGVKAIVLKAGAQTFILACVPGDKKINLKKLAEISGHKKIALASPVEVLQKTGCEIGSVSPIGKVYSLETFFDKKIFENTKVEFNAGLHTKSIRMPPEQLMQALKPKTYSFSE